jgi:hypothetical protein
MATARKERRRNTSRPLNFANNTTDKSGVVQNYDYIPIDYVKCEVIGLDKHHFLNNPNLRFTPKIKDRDVLQLYYLLDENIKLKVFESNRITIEGSFHKYANKGIHNFDDFTHVRFVEVLDKLNERFGIKPENLKIYQLEYGYNITPPIDTDLIIDHLLKHKQKDSEILLSNDRAKYKQFEHQDYIIKTYNKGKQYDCKRNILRVEIKQTDWKKCRLIGICTLDDFIKHDKTIFLNDLLQKWNEILFYDPTITDNAKFLHYRDVNYWNGLRAAKSLKTHSVHANRLREINATKGANVQKLVSDLIREKAHAMRGGNVLLLSQNKHCKLTGIEIHNQRENSFLLSHQGLKYIREHHPERYKELERRFLSGKWTNATPQTKIKEIAHNIRNRYTRQTQRHNPNQTTIFEALNIEFKNSRG